MCSNAFSPIFIMMVTNYVLLVLVAFFCSGFAFLKTGAHCPHNVINTKPQITLKPFTTTKIFLADEKQLDVPPNLSVLSN